MWGGSQNGGPHPSHQGSGHNITTERGNPTSFGFAPHDEPFMLPDADACGDPHSIPLPRPSDLTGTNGSNGHRDG